ncbi:MAG: saccharopine dehydrogenase C-terminal domain-containing protein [Niabella sp.]
MNEPKHIVLFGAGKSATVLIEYLIHHSDKNHWHIIVVDADPGLAKSKTNGHYNTTTLSFNIQHTTERATVIASADIVISMLPPALHFLIAQDCIAAKKNLLTASYMDEPVKKLEKDIRNNGLLFLYEMGLDPGIDHMSAKQLIDTIHSEGGTINSFKSHCGGLVAPGSDNNPWHYKISWNPANVVDAGKSGASYKSNHQNIRKEYADIFRNCDQVIIPQLGAYACYPNRDSLSYMHLYGLQEAATFIRTTLRHPDFCTGWQYLINAGLTDASHTAIIKSFRATPVQHWFTSLLNFYHKAASFEDYLNNVVAAEERLLIKKQFEYIGLNSSDMIPVHVHTSADILRFLLETKLKLNTGDQDMIIMLHEIEYEKDHSAARANSCLVVYGESNTHTAMAKTVGMPLAIAAELILNKEINLTGLHLPIIKEIYEPVLLKLRQNNIVFQEI